MGGGQWDGDPGGLGHSWKINPSNDTLHCDQFVENTPHFC